MHHLAFSTPQGSMVALANEQYLTGLCYELANSAGNQQLLNQHRPASVSAWSSAQQVQRAKHTIVVRGSRLQQGVWRMLQQLEPGITLSYKDMAAANSTSASAIDIANVIAGHPFIRVIPWRSGQAYTDLELA